MPPTTGVAELDSLRSHSRFFKQSYEASKPSTVFLSRALSDMELIYRKCIVNVDGFDTYENFLRCVSNLHYPSSPGYPYMLEATTIGDWLGFDGFNSDPSKIQRLWYSVSEIIRTGKIDCLWRVFIKQEAHKISKASDNRWRLIMCPPLDVQVVWQMVFSCQNDMEIRESFSIPSQQGIELAGGMWKHYRDQWVSAGLTHGMDKSAWDWTVSGWMLDFDLEFRHRMVRGFQSERWQLLASRLYDNAFREPKLLFSDGQVYQQLYPGIMKSGCVNTISTNSHLQVMLHLVYSYDHSIPIYPIVRAVGDDTLQGESHTLDTDWYRKYGVIVKSVTKGLEFVGHNFAEDGPVPCYFGKHVFTLLHAETHLLGQILDSYLRLYVNDSKYMFWLSVAYKLNLGHEVRSKDYYRFWYHNPMGVRGGYLSVAN